MPPRITTRMFIAAILLRYRTNTLDYEYLYEQFCKEFRRHTKEVFTAQQVFKDLGENTDNWFLFKVSGPYKTYDPKCEVRLTSDVNTLEAMRHLFAQTFWSLAEGKTSLDLLRFLGEAKHILTERTESLRLPSFENAFGYIYIRSMRFENPGTRQLYDLAGEPYPY